MNLFEKKKLCQSCGYQGKANVKNRGSFVMLAFLFCCFVAPGFFYLIYMASGVIRSCKSCGAERLIPLESPMARIELAKIEGAK